MGGAGTWSCFLFNRPGSAGGWEGRAGRFLSLEIVVDTARGDLLCNAHPRRCASGSNEYWWEV